MATQESVENLRQVSSALPGDETNNDENLSTTKEDTSSSFPVTMNTEAAAVSSAATNEDQRELQEAADAEAELLKQCKDIYQMFDRGSGQLLSRDLGLALRALGQIPSEHEIDIIVSKIEQEDSNTRGNTRLTFDEFYRVVQENSERTTDIREMVLDSFRSMDPSNTGHVSAAKLTSLLTSLGEVLSAAEMREMLQDAEVDKDGNVNYVKFVEAALSYEVTAADAKLAPQQVSQLPTKRHSPPASGTSQG